MTDYALRIKFGPDTEIEAKAPNPGVIYQMMNTAAKKFFPNTNVLDKELS